MTRPGRAGGGMSSAYDAAGEFYELVAQRQVRSSGPAVRAALTGVDPALGPVLEIGAGTGAITEVIAHALPGARIVAAEPAATMRAVLTSRVASAPALRERVTISPESAQAIGARLARDPGPERFCAVVLFGVVGHLEPAERAALWRALHGVLAPGAPVAVELMGVTAPRVIPPVRLLRERVGDQVYEWWSGGEPAGAGRMRFDTAWRVNSGDAVVREVTESYLWHTLSAAGLAAESGLEADGAAAAGTGTGDPAGTGGAPPVEIAVLRPPRRGSRPDRV